MKNIKETQKSGIVNIRNLPIAMTITYITLAILATSFAVLILTGQTITSLILIIGLIDVIVGFFIIRSAFNKRKKIELLQ